ncbi:hypothetical protein ACEWF1_10115, partial [Bifidobacterium longum subsp. longum]
MSHLTYQEKVDANNAVIKQRLRQYGVVGYSTFLLTKFRNFTSDGSFGVQRYAGNVFLPRRFANEPLTAVHENLFI